MGEGSKTQFPVVVALLLHRPNRIYLIVPNIIYQIVLIGANRDNSITTTTVDQVEMFTER